MMKISLMIALLGMISFTDPKSVPVIENMDSTFESQEFTKEACVGESAHQFLSPGLWQKEVILLPR